MQAIAANWPAPKQIKAFSSTRIAGVSTDEYQGLNLGIHVGDDAIKVKQNRDRLVEQSQMPSTPVWLNQTHSTLVAEIDAPTHQVIDADGVFTSSRGVVCAAMTADCLPILLTNMQGTQVAAVHAGWRGLANGIVENALKKFDGEVMAWLGPAIGAKAFEVGGDVVEAFTAADPNAITGFRPRKQVGKWLADMNILATQRLKQAGVSQVYYSNLCTYHDSERFYSYRRDGVTGRQAAFIWIEN